MGDVEVVSTGRDTTHPRGTAQPVLSSRAAAPLSLGIDTLLSPTPTFHTLPPHMQTWKPDFGDHLCDMRDQLHAASSYRCHHPPFHRRARALGYEEREGPKFDLTEQVASNVLTLELDMMNNARAGKR